MKLINYTGSNISGTCIVEEGFVPSMDIINEECAKRDFIFVMTSSKRKGTHVPGAIVPPAEMSNHMVGHGVDGNLKSKKTGEYYNSVKMGDGRGEDECVIRAIEARGVRWGGEFRKKDEVHFDDAINIKDPKRWHELHAALN